MITGFESEAPGSAKTGAIGFDWIAVGLDGVSWLISWPRKKLIKQ